MKIMGAFLTGKSRIEQTDTEGIWKTLDNQLYLDEDNTIYLVPRYFLTDGFTIPNWIAWFGGSKMQYDTRCSTQHDFECKFHKVIVVNLSITQLKEMKLLREKNGMMICEDIPKKFLEIKETTFNQTNCRFKRMLKTTTLSHCRINLLRTGVNFNVSWLWSKQKLNMSDIYKKEL